MTEARKRRTGQVWPDRRDEFEERLSDVEQQITSLIELVTRMHIDLNAHLGLDDDED